MRSVHDAASRRAYHFFAAAANASAEPLAVQTTAMATAMNGLLYGVWVQRVATGVQLLAVPAAFWFRPLCVGIALVWLAYRASQVLHTPLPELAALLGFDLPLVPIVDLAAVKADGARVHWTLPPGEKPRSRHKLKFEVHLNGAVIDTVPFHESAVTITGLQPSCYYVIRVALVNEAELASRSEPIRFRTKPATSQDFFVVARDGHETDSHDAVDKESVPRVRLYRGLKDITPAIPDAAPGMARESSGGGLAPTKRILIGRRPSPAASGIDARPEPPVDEIESPEGAESIQQLTEKLDALRQENEEAERLAREEEDEETRQKEELMKERDKLKAEAMEKERASRNLKREVNTLERQNTAAQNEKTKHEKLLLQKKQDRRKLQDDVSRWKREAEELKAAVARIENAKTTHIEWAEREKEQLRQKQMEETAQFRSIEDQIKEKNAEIKKLERALKNPSPDGNGEQELNLVQQMQQDAEEERAWQKRKIELQQQYAMAAQRLESTKRFHAEQARYLDAVRAQRRQAEELAAQQQQQQQQQQFSSPSPVTERISGLPRRGDSQRSRRAQSGHSASDSPRLNTFPVTTSAAFAPGLVAVSPFSSAPYLNIHNGMTIAGPAAIEELGMSDEDREKLTGGAPMSPGAGAELLPADLFIDKQEQIVLPGLGSLPGMPGPVSSATAQAIVDRDTGPASPASVSSRSPSVFASPLASQNNLHLGSPENFIDADRRSIRSNRSARATSGSVATGSRFSSMFGIKPRTKTVSNDEGPAFGKVASRSMPRQDPGLPGLDLATRKRNSSISGVFGVDIPPMHDGAADSLPSESGTPQNVAPSRRAFAMRNLFSRDKEGGGWPASFTSGFGRRPGSPRPGSTHSNELPRPSFDSSRWGVDGWPSTEGSAGARSSPLSFGPGWNAPNSSQTRWAGSRHPSRRPSVQYSASGPPADIIEDEDSDALDPDSEPHLAPIGTKPPAQQLLFSNEQQRGENAATPKLNPAAKDFKSFFGIKSKDKAPAPTSAPLGSSNASVPYSVDEGESPPNSRKSRDARSMTTTESSLAESGRNSTDLARTPSHTPSDATGPSPLIGSLSSSTAGKESFMAKITRKSSSGKFSLPTFKRGEKRLDPSSAAASAASGSPSIPPTASEEGESVEDAMSGSVGSLRESGGTPRESREVPRSSGRGWSHVLKRSGKRKGNESATTSVAGVEENVEEGGVLGLGVVEGEDD